MNTRSLTSIGVLMLTLATQVFASNFTYKAASVNEIAKHHQKVIGSHRERFTKPYEIQKLSKNVYWVSISNYNVTVLVGDKGVLLIDAPHGTGKNLLNAIKSITNKPLMAVLYSHAHADHIGDSRVIVQELGLGNIDIIASQEVHDNLISHKVTLPLPVTKIIADELTFEKYHIKAFSNFNGHTQDNTAFLIEDGGRKIIHAIDLVHPDQLEFRSFSNVEDAIAYKNDIDTLLSMEWDVMVTGHSNIGYKEDVKFVRDYIEDVQSFIRQGLAKADFSKHFKGESPFSWYAGYTNEVIDYALEKMAQKYRQGREEEFDIVARSHVRVMFWAMFARAL